MKKKFFYVPLLVLLFISCSGLENVRQEENTQKISTRLPKNKIKPLKKFINSEVNRVFERCAEKMCFGCLRGE